MKIKAIFASALVLGTVGAVATLPVQAQAQRYWNHHHRQEQRDQWRDIATAAGGVGLLGLLSHDNTLTFLGGAGALYSVYRYDQDRRGGDRERRLRAEYFSHPYFYRDGVRYDRHTVWRHGHEYYQFVRHR